MNHLIIDTEYTWAPGHGQLDAEGKPKVPHPPNAVIQSIAFVWLRADVGGAKVKMGVVRGHDESSRLRHFLDGLSKTNNPTLVTFNGRGSDVPLITARLMCHGIQSRQWALIHAASRYREYDHVDLYDLLGLYGAQRRGGLDDWAQCIGWPGKLGVDGSQVASLLAAGKRDEVDAYCLCDAVQTAALFIRHQYTSDAIDQVTYLEAAGALLTAAQYDERTVAMAIMVDHETWFLGQKERAAQMAEAS